MQPLPTTTAEANLPQPLASVKFFPLVETAGSIVAKAVSGKQRRAGKTCCMVVRCRFCLVWKRRRTEITRPGRNQSERAGILYKKIYDKLTAEIRFEDKIIYTFFESLEKVHTGYALPMNLITFVEESQRLKKNKISYNSY